MYAAAEPITFSLGMPQALSANTRMKSRPPPEHIFAQTGRLPAFAGGNADVDIEMLTCAKFALLVNHDDAEREFAYTKAAEKSLATAEQLGWTVVSVKDDWATVFKKDGGAR